MSYSSARLGRCTTTSTPWVGAPRPPHLINFPPHRAIPKTTPGAMSCSYHGPAIMSSPPHAVSAVQSLPSCPVRNHVVLCPDPVCTMCSSPRRTFSVSCPKRRPCQHSFSTSLPSVRLSVWPFVILSLLFPLVALVFLNGSVRLGPLNICICMYLFTFVGTAKSPVTRGFTRSPIVVLRNVPPPEVGGCGPPYGGPPCCAPIELWSPVLCSPLCGIVLYGFVSSGVVFQRIVWYRALPRPVVSYYVVSCRVIPFSCVGHYIVSYRSASYRIASHRIECCRIVSRRVVRYRCRVSYRSASRLVVWCNTVAGRIIS